MSEEKMNILRMLENKQITSEQAARMLVEANKGENRSKEEFTPTHAPMVTPPQASYPKESASYPNSNATSFGSTHSHTSSPHASSPHKTYGNQNNASIDGFADELSRKLGVLFQDMQPKLQKITEIVVEKTANAADSLSRSLAVSPSTPPTWARTEPPSFSTAKSTGFSGIERVVEIHVAGNGAELSISGLNGPVLVKGYNGDKISAKIHCEPKRSGAPIELMTLGNKYHLHYDENDFKSVCVDAFVPEFMFDNVRIQTINGALTVSTLTTKNLQLENANGPTEMTSICADNILLDSSNGSVRLVSVAAQMAAFENFNANISVQNLEIACLKMSATGGAMSVQIPDFRRFASYDWNLETSNGKMDVILPSATHIGYDIKANAALGTVKIGLVGLAFSRNEKSFAEAKSSQYDGAATKVKLQLQTSNAPLVVQ